MRKSEYAKQQQQQRRRSRRTQPESESARRYQQTSASGRDGNESSHSLHELPPRRRQKRSIHDPMRVTAATRKYNAKSSPASKYGTAKIKKSANAWYAVVIGRVPGIYHGWPLAWEQVDNFYKGRAYKCAGPDDALETFMRWRNGKCIHPVSSLMLHRNENAGGLLNSLFGSPQAREVRARSKLASTQKQRADNSSAYTGTKGHATNIQTCVHSTHTRARHSDGRCGRGC